MDALSRTYEALLAGSYDCLDRIVINAYYRMGHDAGGFRVWWRRLTGSDETLDNAHLMRMAGRFSRRLRAWATENDIPIRDCRVGDPKHEIGEEFLRNTTVQEGLFLILVSRAPAPVWDIHPNRRITRKKPATYVNHYSFHILDRDWGHITIKISGHPPLGAEQFGQINYTLPGKTAVRRPPEQILSEIDPNLDFRGKRPDFLHQLFQPRTIPRIQPRLRRFNGRHVKPTYVFGNDDRQPYQDSSYPWGCVGKIYNSDGFMGSGALVYGDIVVTAGHMVPWNSIANGSWSMRFIPDYFNGSSLYGAGVESYVSDVLGYNTNNSVAGYDWAICKLYNAIGNTAGYFGFNGYSSDWENSNVWTVLGYPVAVASGEQPSWQGGISIHDDDGDSNGGEELESDNADTTPGDSGGPIFAWWSNDPRVIGVVSGQEEEYVFPFSLEDNNIFASGSGLTNLIAWGRSNWG